MEYEVKYTARISGTIYIESDNLEEAKEIATKRVEKNIETFPFLVEEIEEVDVCESD